MAVSLNWESYLWVSLLSEPYYLGSILGPPDFRRPSYGSFPRIDGPFPGNRHALTF